MEDLRIDNVDRLFSMIGELSVTINQMNGSISKVCANIDDVYRRIDKLEIRDEKFLDRIEKISVLLARVEDSTKHSTIALEELDKRVQLLEHDSLTIRNNWKWLAGITATLGGLFGLIVNVVSRIFN